VGVPRYPAQHSPRWTAADKGTVRAYDQERGEVVTLVMVVGGGVEGNIHNSNSNSARQLHLDRGGEGNMHNGTGNGMEQLHLTLSWTSHTTYTRIVSRFSKRNTHAHIRQDAEGSSDKIHTRGRIRTHTSPHKPSHQNLISFHAARHPVPRELVSNLSLGGVQARMVWTANHYNLSACTTKALAEVAQRGSSNNSGNNSSNNDSSSSSGKAYNSTMRTSRAAGRSRAHTPPRVSRQLVHPSLVPKYGASGPHAGRIDRNDCHSIALRGEALAEYLENPRHTHTHTLRFYVRND